MGGCLPFVLLEPRGTLGPEMNPQMAFTANCNEIFFHIASQTTSLLHVMNLQIFETSALLASPAVAL